MELWQSVREDIYNKTITTAGLNLIFDNLSRFSLGDVKRGIGLHINDTQNGQFPITPTHVVANIEGRAEERGAHAWAKLAKAVETLSPYDDICFDDAGIHKIVQDEGGWIRLCGMNLEDFKFLQNRFIKVYSALVSKREFSYPKILKGISNSSNSGNKLADGSPIAIIPPVVVGDKEKARLVYQGGSNGRLEVTYNNEISNAVAGMIVNNNEDNRDIK